MRHWVLGSLTVCAIAVLCVLARVVIDHGGGGNPLGAGIQARVDSVVVTQPAFDSSTKAIERNIHAHAVAIAKVDSQVKQDKIYVAADSNLLREAKDLRDSLTAALSLVNSLTVENRDLLDKVNLLERDTLFMRTEIEQDTARINAMTRLNHDIAVSLKKGGCSLMFLPCPTRTESFVLGAVTAAAGFVAASK